MQRWLSIRMQKMHHQMRMDFENSRGFSAYTIPEPNDLYHSACTRRLHPFLLLLLQFFSSICSDLLSACCFLPLPIAWPYKSVGLFCLTPLTTLPLSILPLSNSPFSSLSILLLFRCCIAVSLHSASSSQSNYKIRC